MRGHGGGGGGHFHDDCGGWVELECVFRVITKLYYAGLLCSAIAVNRLQRYFNAVSGGGWGKEEIDIPRHRATGGETMTIYFGTLVLCVAVLLALMAWERWW